jgi:hypothetical protein
MGQHWPVVVALVFALAAMFPIFRGQAYSMTGALMSAVYPWAGTTPAAPVTILGYGFPQTDQAEQFYPAIVNITRAIRSGELPLWDPFTFAGTPNHHIGPAEATHPIRLLLYLFLPPLMQLQAWIFVTLLSATLGMYCFLRNFGIAQAPALFGGMIWGLNGGMIFWSLFENFAGANALIPWVLLLIQRSFTERSIACPVGAGLMWGILFHTGHLQFVYVTSIILAAYTVYTVVFQAITQSGAFTLRSVGHSAARLAWIAIPALAVSAPVWIREIEWQPYLARTSLPVSVSLREAVPLGEFLRVLVVTAFSIHKLPQPPNLALQVYVGALPLIFALFGLLVLRPLAWTGALLSAIGSGFVLGCVPLVASFRYTLPMFSFIHIGNLFVIADLGLAILGGLGLEWLLSGAGRRFQSAFGRASLSGVTALILIAQGGQLISVLYKSTPTQPALAQWQFPVTPAIAAMHALQGSYHVMPMRAEFPQGSWFSPMLPGRLSDMFGLHSIIGYESIIPSYQLRLWQSVSSGQVAPEDSAFSGFYASYWDTNVDLERLRRLSIGFILATPQSHPRDREGRDLVQNGSLLARYHGPDGIIYQVPQALPRVYLVHKIRQVTEDAALGALINGGFDAAEESLLTESDGAPQATSHLGNSQETGGEARITAESMNSLVVLVSTTSPALLQANESWAPGWRADIDGRPVALYRSNYAFRAVPVPAGQHVVTMRYSPRSALWGLLMEAAGVLISLVILSWYIWIWITSVGRAR